MIPADYTIRGSDNLDLDLLVDHRSREANDDKDHRGSRKNPTVPLVLSSILIDRLMEEPNDHCRS